MTRTDLTRGGSNRVLTFDLDLQSPTSYGHKSWSKVEDKGQSVQKIEQFEARAVEVRVGSCTDLQIISMCTARGTASNHSQSYMELEKIALNRGRTDRISLTHDLDHDL